MLPLLLIATLAAASPSSTAAPTLSNAPVAELDLVRYSGTWHEIARLPMFFQRGCAGDVTATYTPASDGTIEVRNACRNKDGGRDQSVGVARRVPGSAGALKVRFAPGWLSWLPMVWADYWVVALDPQYRWALVGSPSRNYLWVLSRTPAIDSATFDGIREGARRRGYAVENLIVSGELTR